MIENSILQKRKVSIFGAGQAGMMVKTWIPAGSEAFCFIDNDQEMKGKFVGGLPVMALEEALLYEPGLIFIAVLNRDAEAEIRKQIRGAGYDGEIRSAQEIRGLMDLRLSALRLAASEIRRRKTEGAVAELGVYRGEFAAEINREFPDRKIYLFDTFSGFDERDIGYEDAAPRRDFSDTDTETVKKALPHPDRAVLVKGYFPESLQGLEESDDLEFAYVSIDPDLYRPALEGLRYFWPRLASGGMIMIHDYTSAQFPGIKKAVDEYANEHGGVTPVPLMDLHGTAVIVKP